MKPEKTTLKTWLFTRPIQFTLRMLIVFLLFWLPDIFPVINKIPLSDVVLISLGLGTTIWAIYKLVKSLPLSIMPRNDFVAITNGYRITLFIALAVWMVVGIAIEQLFRMRVPGARVLPMMYQLSFYLLSMYLLGVSLSGFCVKYVRARIFGMSKWKVILSIPFTFIMAWIPGYLIDDKSNKTNLQINSKWFARFNKWATATQINATFVFVCLILLTNALLTKHPFTILLPATLFLIFLIWQGFSKPDLKSKINRGYSWVAIIINIILLVFTIYTLKNAIMTPGTIIGTVTSPIKG